MDLEQRLQEEIQKKIWNQESIDRVRKVIELIPSRKIVPYRILEGIEDYKLYYELHPEWKGKTLKEINKEKNKDHHNFYVALNKRLDKSSISYEERLQIMKHFINMENETWRDYQTIDDWIMVYNAHPEWNGRNTREMIQDEISGANRFYAAFIRWTNQQTQDKKERKKLRRKLFPNLSDNSK